MRKKNLGQVMLDSVAAAGPRPHEEAPMTMTNAQAALLAAAQATTPGQVQTTRMTLDRAASFKTWLDAENKKG